MERYWLRITFVRGQFYGKKIPVFDSNSAETQDEIDEISSLVEMGVNCLIIDPENYEIGLLPCKLEDVIIAEM